MSRLRRRLESQQCGLIPLVCISERTHHIASAAVGMAIEECRSQVMSVLTTVPDDVEVIVAYNQYGQSALANRRMQTMWSILQKN